MKYYEFVTRKFFIFYSMKRFSILGKDLQGLYFIVKNFNAVAYLSTNRKKRRNYYL